MAIEISALFDRAMTLFPSRWKTAEVTPIFKDGDPTDVTKYPPISVLPVLSKIAERQVHNALYSFLCENDLIYITQSGFRLRSILLKLP